MSLDDLLERLRNKTTIGKNVKFYERDSREGYILGKVIDEVSVLTADKDGFLSYKHFVQKIIGFDNEIRFRQCYYSLDKKKTRIVFGQFASSVHKKDYEELMNLACEKGFF